MECHFNLERFNDTQHTLAPHFPSPFTEPSISTRPSAVTILCITDPRSDFSQFPAISNGTRSPGWSVFSLPARGSILFSSISHLYLNYIHYYLYTCLYDVTTLSSLYIDLAPSPLLRSFQYYSCSIILEDALSSLVDTTPNGSSPLSGLRPSAVGSPLRGSG